MVPVERVGTTRLHKKLPADQPTATKLPLKRQPRGNSLPQQKSPLFRLGQIKRHSARSRSLLMPNLRLLGPVRRQYETLWF